MYLWVTTVKSEELVVGYYSTAKSREEAQRRGLAAWYSEHEEDHISVKTSEVGKKIIDGVWKARTVPNRKVEAWPVVVGPEEDRVVLSDHLNAL